MNLWNTREVLMDNARPNYPVGWWKDEPKRQLEFWLAILEFLMLSVIS
jgi:hypothetical protein